MTIISRRRFIAGASAGLSALSLPRALHAQSAAFDYDAIIIGAGPAGLAAAHEFQLLGKSFILIEARDRIGGRVFTDTSLGAPFDAGATYIHFADENPWRSVAETLGFETVNSRSLDGGVRSFVNGSPVERKKHPGVREEVESRLDDDEDDVPDVSMTERFADEEAEVQQRAVMLARMDVGEEPERVSALDYSRLWDGPDFLVPAGFGQLVAAYGNGIPVKLSTKASVVDWSGAGVKVTTDAGTITARAAIITVSVGVLAAGTLQFIPPLPQATQAGISGLGMGALTKLALAFDGNRFDVPSEMWLIDSDGPRSGFQFNCWPFNREIVIAWLGGDQARELARLGERDAAAIVLDRFASLVGNDVRDHFTGGRLGAWTQDPFAMGCYSHALPGHAEARDQLAESVADRLYFAGEATGGAPHDDFGPAMTAGGAFLAGQTAARNIAQL